MKKIVTMLALAFALSLVVASLGFAARTSTIHVAATLNAKQEVPKQVVKDTKAKGRFTGTLVGRKLTWKLTFSGLTGQATAAHLHLGKAGVAGNVIVPLCAPCKSGAHGKTTVSAAVKKALAHHKVYVNVHTAKNPNGEIRGQVAEM